MKPVPNQDQTQFKVEEVMNTKPTLKNKDIFENSKDKLKKINDKSTKKALEDSVKAVKKESSKYLEEFKKAK